VCGQQEVEGKTVNVRGRGGEAKGAMTIPEIIAFLKDLIDNFQ
jgi:threonyl-tRNA synthetase